MNDSARFSGEIPALEAGGLVASRPPIGRLALTGHAGQGVIAYRSEFLHLWIVGSPDLDLEPVTEGLLDLERGALGLPEGAIAPPGLALPVEVQHALTGLQFLKDTLWETRPDCAGLLFFDGRVWAVRSALDVQLEQMTGALVRWRWHEWEGGSPLAWTELNAAEVWRLEIRAERGALYAHYRPSLAAVRQVETGADSFAAAARAARAQVVPAESRAESRGARRRRHRQESARASRIPVAAPAPLIARVPTSPRNLATPRIARKKFRLSLIQPTRRTLGLGSAIAAALVALVAVGFAARKPITALVVGRYSLQLTTSPSGARVRVDGRPVTGRTPITLALEPGQHRVDVNYGEYASAGFAIEGSRGDALKRDFAWSGALGVASADSSVRLAVSLDGTPLGNAPLWKESVPVGRHRLAFTAKGVRSWEEEVQVRSGQSARVTAVPVKVPPYGLVTARAELVSSNGVEELDGIPVYVDGIAAGVTPVDLKLFPGPHSIRIARAAGAPSIHMIDVQAGGRFYASAGFGRPADPLVVFDPPKRISRSAPPAIPVRLAADLPLPIRQAALHVRPQGGAFARVAIPWNAEGGREQGTLIFPLDRLGDARALTYYVEIETREGEEYFSELHTIPIVP